MSASQSVKPGFFDLSDWGTLKIEGPDAADYLNRMSTVAIKKLEPGFISHGAFLNGRGLVIALGMMERLGPSSFHFHFSSGQGEKLAAHLEMFHFGEKLSFTDVSPEFALVGFWKSEPFEGGKTLEAKAGMWNGVSILAWREDVRPDFIWGKIDRKDFQRIRGQVVWLDAKDYDFLRIEAGIPQVGREVSDSEIILESGFDRAVARNKGCYPGQEVVERIFTYGSVNRKLLPVKFEGPAPASFPVDIEIDGKTVGRWMAGQRGVGLAYLQKQYWDYAEGVKVGGATLHWKQS